MGNIALLIIHGAHDEFPLCRHQASSHHCSHKELCHNVSIIHLLALMMSWSFSRSSALADGPFFEVT